MALSTFLPDNTKPKEPKKHDPQRRRKLQKKDQNKNQKQPLPPSSTSTSSWDQIKNLLTCKQADAVHVPSKNQQNPNHANVPPQYSKLGSSCSSICSFKDVVHCNTRVVHRADSKTSSPDSSSLGQDQTGLLTRKSVNGSTGSSSRSLRSNGGGCYTSSSKAMQFRKLSGCYECHMIVDPSRYPVPRTTICSCSQCGEVFPKIESLELHQKVRHAVSELGPEDSGRNIVEIIFKSSWLKKENPICKIERILKVQNTQRTIQRFEDCRDMVKSRVLNSTKKNPRCAADGNELLRFYCTTLACLLGSHGSSNLCGAIPGCGVCTIIRHGFHNKDCKGVKTYASSGKAHDSMLGCTDGRRAMIVCRVIAGRVKHVGDDKPSIQGEDASGPTCSLTSSYDSVAGSSGVYSNLEELFVFNPKAILSCFVVIYEALES